MFPSQCEMILSLCTSCLCCCLTMADQKHPDSNQSQQITKALRTRFGPEESPQCWHWRLQLTVVCVVYQCGLYSLKLSLHTFNIWSIKRETTVKHVCDNLLKPNVTLCNLCTDTSSYFNNHTGRLSVMTHKATCKITCNCCSRCTGPSSHSCGLETAWLCLEKHCCKCKDEYVI